MLCASAETTCDFGSYNQSVPTVRHWLCVLLIALASAWSAHGQTGSATGATPQTPPGRVSITAEQFGVGDTVRPGEFFGVRLALTDTADKPRRVAVVMHIPDDDGDTTLITRLVTLNPGQPIGVWIEGRLPAWFNPNGAPPVQFSVHEADDESDNAEEAASGRQIGMARISPRKVIAANYGMIGVVGRRAYGLDQYRIQGNGGDSLPVAHEPTEVITGLTPETLPDDWRSLAGFKAIAWTDGDPIRMEGNRPQALREWVTRGGHLVIVLPTVGGTWDNASNPLLDLMPAATFQTVEDASLEPYRALITTPDFHSRKLPVKAMLHVFEPNENATTAEFTPIAAGPDGVVIARRLVGVGMVTVIGLDLSDRMMLDSGMVRAEALWHQVLGERFTIPLPNAQIMNFGRATVYADRVIGNEISKGATAAAGVLLGLIVFGVYWLLAGPGGYAILKSRGLIRHTWVGFVVTTAVFTLIAWMGATSIKLRKVEAWHLTFLDHVYGQSVQRTRTWASVLLPDYGEETLRVGDPDTDTQWRQSITTWTDADVTRGAISFPDARGYAVDVRRPESITVPTRATIKQLQVDWVGGPQWTAIAPVAPEQTPKLTRQGENWVLNGQLSHKLPEALRDATVVLVTGSVDEETIVKARADRKASFLRFKSYTWSLPGAWKSDSPLDLSTLKPDTNSDAAQTFSRWVPSFALGAFDPTIGLDASKRTDALNMISYYPMLEPPDWEKSGVNISSRAIISRRSAHGLDLGKWFTQPCLIITGSVMDSAMPTPLRLVNGERARPVPSTGRTVVRWVYPLDASPLRVNGLNPEPAKDPKKNDADASTPN